MIYVQRNVAAPAILTKKDSNGETERDRATAHYNEPANCVGGKWKTFKFNVYKHRTVKKALRHLFHGKCAYCESYIEPPVAAVEHYRPKGAVMISGEKRQPGYYWLGSDWDNLLPSCAACNQICTHDIPDQGARVVGKGNRFPIECESKRAKAPDEEVGEKPLLLNPCLDHPENYLEFILEGAGGGLIRPKLRPDDRISRRAEVSIEVYALQRKTLVDRRRGRLILVRMQIGRVNKLIQRLNDDPDNAIIAGDLEEEMKELGRMQKDDQQFLAMTRQCISEMLSV